ncbi:MAG: DNA polymerase III subunit beta [Phycisphaerae bacterium]|nr:DNA polymerase III subunit beta [Phycisphaerae bacterium]
MKLKCSRSALNEAIQLASSIVPTRTPKPVLQCAKLVADQENQSLRVIATDNEVTIDYTLSGVLVEVGGTMVLPADRMGRILHETKDENIDLELIESTCHVTGQDSEYNIYGYDPDDFPVIEIEEQENVLEIEASVLKKMIHMSAFSAARESSRYAINGVLWELSGKKLRMVATDGRRLAQIDGGLSVAIAQDQTAIVPVKAMAVIERVLTEPMEKVRISIENNQIVVRTEKVKFSANLVQGRFPKYTDVIPTGCDIKAHMQKESFLSAVRRAALLTNEHTNGIVLSYSSDNLCLSSSTPEAGDAEINMPIAFDGPDMKIGFNPQYILEALKVIDTPEIVMEFAGENKPGVLRSGKDFLYVLMPVTV